MDADQFALQVRAELREIGRTPAFLTTLARHVLPVIGVTFFGWPAVLTFFEALPRSATALLGVRMKP